MSTGKVSGMSKIAKEKNQRILMELVSQPGNDICADCKAKAPRWASHNLGIFICVRCASIHRKIGTHITKVKSLTLDDWTKEQVENMKSIGNVKANQHWNPDEKKHPLPTNMEESERDSELEKYIRSKYEFQRFRPLSARAAEKLGPSQSVQSRTTLPSSQSHSAGISPPKRSQTAPIHSGVPASGQTTHPPLPSAPSIEARSFSSGSGPSFSTGIPPRRSSFNPFPSTSTSAPTQTQAQAPAPALAPPPNQRASLTSSTFNDLISIQGPSLNSSLPLQYVPSTEQQPMLQPFQPMVTGMAQSPSATFSSSPFGTPASGIGSTNPYANLSLTSTPTGAPSPFTSPTPGSNFRSVTLPPSLQSFGQSTVPLSSMPTGAPNTFQQPFAFASPNPNPFTQMQMQMQAQAQQYPGTPLATNPSPSPFFTPSPQQPQMQQQQQPFQTGAGAFQSSPPPFSTQAQQAQQIFQGMAAGGGGGNMNNPFSHWG